MDENISIRAYQIKQLCQVSGGKLSKTTDKKERARRIENFSARIASNHCIFTDKTVRTGTFNLSKRA